MSSIHKVSAKLYLGEPSPELLDWAKENLNEDPETKYQKISDLRDMIYARGECIPERTDDEFLLRFLRARHFVVERAHRVIVNYHHFKEDNPHLCNDVDLSTLRHMALDGIVSVPSYVDDNVQRIFLFRIGLWNPEVYTIDDVLRSVIAALEMGLLEARSQILGLICIFDLEGFSTQQVWYFSPSVARKVIQIMVTSYPGRVHAVHIVNQSYIFDLAYNLFKPFLNPRMKEKIFLHGEDMKSLHKHINPTYLPQRYGGMQLDLSYHEWMNNILKDEKFVAELRSLGYRDSELEPTDEEGSRCD